MVLESSGDKDKRDVMTENLLPPKPFQPYEDWFDRLRNANPEELDQLFASGEAAAWGYTLNKALKHLAIYADIRLDIAERLIRMGADVEGDPGLAITPFMSAAIHCRLGAMELFLRHGADPNRPDESLIGMGETALGYAIQNNSVEAVDLLIRYKCDLNQRTGRHCLPVSEAVAQRRTDIFERLRDAGACVDYEELACAAIATDNVALLNTILGRFHVSKRVPHKNFRFTTPIHSVESCHRVDEILDLVAATVEDLNCTNEPYGRTPLMFAAGAGNKECIAALLRRGADPSIRDNFGDTAADFGRRHEGL